MLEWLFAEAVVVAGSVLQRSVGFGLGLLAAPFLGILGPSLVPGPVLACAFSCRSSWLFAAVVEALV